MATTTVPAGVHPHQYHEHADLRRFLGALRRQLWWRDALVVAAVSAVVGAAISAGVAVWPTRHPLIPSLETSTLALIAAGISLCLGLCFALVRRPSTLRAARLADRDLQLASRLATAAEVLDGRLGGVLASAQLSDTWRVCSGITPWRAYPSGWSRVRLALIGLALSLLLLGLVTAGTLSPIDIPGTPLALDPSQTSDATSTTDAASISAAEAALAADASTNPAAAAQTLEELQAAAAQSQAAEAALQQLGDALRTTAAARDVGDSLRRGDYQDAADRLVTLGAKSDQLSRISKRELANAMQRAAFQTSKVDPDLALAETQVARALTRQVYSETKSSLENLAKTIGDVKAGVVTQEGLAKQLDQLQQQPPGTNAGGGQDGEEYIPNVPGQEPTTAGLVKGATSSISVPGPEGDPSKADRAGVGQNPGGDPLGDAASRLSVPAVDVPVDSQLASDRGRNKAQPNAPVVKISDTNQNGVRQSDVAQPGDPVQDVAETAIEPPAQRQAVRDYFKATADPGTPATP